MIVYPAIDIRDGRCVMLTQGKFDQEKVYYENPEEVAKIWEDKGAQALHIVDLDGALEGESRNLDKIRKIIGAISIPIQLGGGIRSLETIKSLIDIGVGRVIIGTKAVEDRDMLKEAVGLYGERIVVGIDAKDGHVAVAGWTKTSEIRALEFAKEIEELGVKTIIYTDIARDGMLGGPNFQAIKNMKESLSVDLIASGGISSEEDLRELRKIGLAGAIVGKALYEGRIDLTKSII